MIIPSIDMMSGKIVQLENGKKKVFEDTNYRKYIKKFSVFPEVNIIDLDAAMSNGSNKEKIFQLCKELRCNVGGGIRSKEIAYEYLRHGAQNIIIGTSATPEFLKALPAHRVIVALDIKEGKIAIEGWKKTIDAQLETRIKELEGYCHGFLITSVDVEGLTQGPDMKLIRKLQGLTSKRIIVAGGICTYEQIKEIDALGFDQVLGMTIYTKKIDLNKALAQIINFSKGLVPTIVQDPERNVLMLAYSNRQSVYRTLTTRKATYFSRSRNRLWIKGEQSKNTQKLLELRYDCDCDSLIYVVEQKGVACHRGKYSCFTAKEFSFEHLRKFLEQRIDAKGEDSYTAKISQNNEKLSKKIIEEAFEVTQAQATKDRIWEIADLCYFILVYMAKNNIRIEDIKNELSLRHKNGI